MNLTARIKLKLRKQENKLVLMYNTFEKASFDQFLVASMARNTRSENIVFNYIDDITGAGSLNNHLKKMYQKIKDLEEDKLDKILNDSMYPILKVDSSNKYTYYPDLDISILKDRVYNGDIYEDENLPKLLVPEGEFYNSNIESGNITNTSDIYAIRIQEDQIKIQLTPKIEKEVDVALFSNSVDVQVRDISGYRGVIHDEVEGSNWNIMSGSKLSDVTFDSNLTFIHNGDHFQITNTYLKRTRITQLYGIYMYKENQFFYEKKNRKYCDLVMKHLLSSGEINTFKVKKLIPIIESLNYEDMQVYVNRLLDIKDSKEISEIGFDLIAKGFKKNWSEGAITNFTKYMKTDQELISTYQVSQGQTFALHQLYRIYKKNRKILSVNDRNIVEQYLNNRNDMIKEMEAIMGEITLSGGRQKSRDLEKTKEVKRFRKLSNDLQGHFEDDIRKLSDEQLAEIYKQVLEYQDLHNYIATLISAD